MGGSIRNLKYHNVGKILNRINRRLRDDKLNTNKHNANKNNNVKCSNLQCPQHPFLHNTAFIGTAAIDRYAQKISLEQSRPFPNPDTIFLTNSTRIRASPKEIPLFLPQTSTFNKTFQIFPSNNNISLVSLKNFAMIILKQESIKKLAQFTTKTKQHSQHHVAHMQACMF